MIVCLVVMMSGMLCDLCGRLSSLVLFTKYAILVDFLIYFLRFALFFVVVLLCYVVSCSVLCEHCVLCSVHRCCCCCCCCHKREASDVQVRELHR